MFINQLKPATVFYADGHHSIKTSNHRDMLAFYNSAKYSIGTLSSNPKEAGIKLAGGLERSATEFFKAMSHDPVPTINPYQGGKLNSEPNEEGFNKRRMSGHKAGISLLANIIRQNPNVRRDAENNIIDSLDIVAHSMGYAYALGMTDALKGKIPFGRFYVIAPENACSGDVDLDAFEEVWQYGSNLGEPNEDPLHEQDGVAPQCAVKGLDDVGTEYKEKRGRAFIPKGESKGFLQSHSIGNYKWIFTRGKKAPGYVKSRS